MSSSAPQDVTVEDEASGRWTRLKLAALAAAAIHLAAGIAMLMVLRQGLDPHLDVVDRMAFLADHTLLWTVGWLFWNAAALSFLYFSMAFAHAHGSGSEKLSFILQFAVLLAAAGVVADLAGEAIEMAVLPRIASRAIDDIATGQNGSATMGLFSSLHQTAVMLTAYVANGLYSLTALTLSWSTRASHRPWVWIAGLGAGLVGLFLSVVALIDWGAGMIVANAVLVPCILVWQAGVGLESAKQERQGPGRDTREF